jgi:hypothetical protein
MRSFAASLVMLCLGLPQGAAEQTSADNEPGTLATAKLPSQVRKKIEQAVFEFTLAPPEKRNAIAANVPLERVRLGPHGRWVWQATAPPEDCGSHACEYWLFDPETGASLVDDADGSEFDVLDSRHHGWRDFATSSAISCCVIVTTYYQFDGHKYHKVRNVEDKFAEPDGL